MIKSIITDVEGTVAPYSFFSEVLANYVRTQVAAFAEAQGGRKEVREKLDALCREVGVEPSPAEAIAYFKQCSVEERDGAACRALTALIADEGYRSGAVSGTVYEDVARNLRLWHADGLRLFGYSSQSVSMQQGLFANSDQGNLADLFSGYFDTLTGYKQEVSSYEIICSEIGGRAGDILYLSDTPAELDAAKAAGMQTRLICRDAEPLDTESVHTAVRDFDAISLN